MDINKYSKNYFYAIFRPSKGPKMSKGLRFLTVLSLFTVICPIIAAVSLGISSALKQRVSTDPNVKKKFNNVTEVAQSTFTNQYHQKPPQKTPLLDGNQHATPEATIPAQEVVEPKFTGIPDSSPPKAPLLASDQNAASEATTPPRKLELKQPQGAVAATKNVTPTKMMGSKLCGFIMKNLSKQQYALLQGTFVTQNGQPFLPLDFLNGDMGAALNFLSSLQTTLAKFNNDDRFGECRGLYGKPPENEINLKPILAALTMVGIDVEEFENQLYQDLGIEPSRIDPKEIIDKIRSKGVMKFVLFKILKEKKLTEKQCDYLKNNLTNSKGEPLLPASMSINENLFEFITILDQSKAMFKGKNLGKFNCDPAALNLDPVLEALKDCGVDCKDELNQYPIEKPAPTKATTVSPITMGARLCYFIRNNVSEQHYRLFREALVNQNGQHFLPPTMPSLHSVGALDLLTSMAQQAAEFNNDPRFGKCKGLHGNPNVKDINLKPVLAALAMVGIDVEEFENQLNQDLGIEPVGINQMEIIDQIRTKAIMKFVLFKILREKRLTEEQCNYLKTNLINSQGASVIPASMSINENLFDLITLLDQSKARLKDENMGEFNCDPNNPNLNPLLRALKLCGVDIQKELQQSKIPSKA